MMKIKTKRIHIIKDMDIEKKDIHIEKQGPMILMKKMRKKGDLKEVEEVVSEEEVVVEEIQEVAIIIKRI